MKNKIISAAMCLHSLTALADNAFQNEQQVKVFNKSIEKELRNVKKLSRNNPWNDPSRSQEFTYIGLSRNGCSNEVFSKELSKVFTFSHTEQLANSRLNTLIANLFMTADLARNRATGGDNAYVVAKNTNVLSNHILIKKINEKLGSLGKREIESSELINILGKNADEICKEDYLADDLVELILQNI